MTGFIDGRGLELASVPLNRLEELPASANQLVDHIGDNTNPHGTTLHQQELVINSQVKISAAGGILELKNSNGTDYAVLNLKGVNLFGGEINQISVQELDVIDSFINLNSNFVSGTPIADGGMRIIRGSSNNLALYWNETLKRWRVQQEDISGVYDEFDLAHLGDVYTKTESDQRFVNAIGDTMTGQLVIHPNSGNTALKLKSTPDTGKTELIFENGVTQAEISLNNGAFKIIPPTRTEIYKPLDIKSQSGNSTMTVSVSDATQPQISTNKSYFDFLNKIYAPGLDAKSQTITNVAAPVASTDAVNLTFADARYVNVAGDTMTGDLLLEGNLRNTQDFITLNYGQADSNAGLIVSNSGSNGILFFNTADDNWYLGTEASYSQVVTEESLNNPENTQTIRDLVGAMVSGNTENGLSVTYTGTKFNFDVNDPVISLSGDVSGSAQMLNLGNTNIAVTVHDDSHNHTSSTLPNLTVDVQNIVGAMVSGNTENGLSVTYAGSKLNFDVNDPVISLSGDVSGSAQMLNLGNTNIAVTVHDDSHNHTNLNGTVSLSYKLGTASPSDGITLKASGGALQVRNLSDTSYADLHVQSLYVHGPSNIIYSETISVADNIMLLNSNVTGAPSENAGVEIKRGTSTNAQLLWNESIDAWQCGVAGNLATIVRYDTSNYEYIQDTAGALINSAAQTGISVFYDDSNNRIAFTVPSTTISLAGDATGSVSFVTGNSVTLNVTILNDSHNHSSSTVTDLTESVQDIVGAMVTGNTESGISVTYDDSLGKLNFDVNDFTLTFTGSYVSGSATITNLSNTNISLSVLDSPKLSGLTIPSGVINNEANKIVRTDSNGYARFGWVATTSGDAGTNTISRVYASNDDFIRYYTLSNFAAQVLAQGSTKNAHTHSASEITTGVVPVSRGGTNKSSYTVGSYLKATGTQVLSEMTPAQVRADIDAAATNHTHTVVNNLRIMRMSSSFTGNGTGRLMVITGFLGTNYSVIITPSDDPGGNLGEYWVKRYDGYFYVYSSGTSTAGFHALVVGIPS